MEQPPKRGRKPDPNARKPLPAYVTPEAHHILTRAAEHKGLAVGYVLDDLAEALAVLRPELRE